MIKNTYRIAEIVCVAALLVFIGIVFAINSGGSDKNIIELSAPVIEAADVNDMKPYSTAETARVFGFDISKTEGVVYYNNDNIMDVSELLIIKLNDKADAEAFKAAIQAHVDEQKALFKNYAPEQYSLLNQSILKSSGNVVFYCTSTNANAAYAAFKKAL